MDRSRELQALPDSSFQTLLLDLRTAWQGRLHDLWRQHQTRAAGGECSLEEWDPAREVYTAEELVTLFALVREVSLRRLHLHHFAVQIAAGFALIEGNFIEMKTGEGKTIVGLFPAVLFGLITQLDWEVVHSSDPAMPRRSVHVITANEYLAQRDALQLLPVYRFFGLSVDVLPTRYDPTESRIAYKCDIIFGTVSQFGFDYLRDHNVKRTGDKQQGHLYFAILDEVDHILVDEGTTPLILSRENPEYAESQRRTVFLFDHLARQLYEAPQIFTKGEAQALQLTPLGATSLSLLVREYLAKPTRVEDPRNLAMPTSLLGVLCAQAFKLATGRQMGAREKLLALDAERELRFTPEGIGWLREFAAEWLKSGDEKLSDGIRIAFKVVSAFLRSRYALSQLAQLSQEDVRAMQRHLGLWARFSFSSQLRRLFTESGFAEKARGPIETFLGEWVKALQGQQEESCLQNLRLLVTLLRAAGLASPDHRFWQALLAEVGTEAHDESSEPQAIRRFGHDLQRFWLTPISRTLSEKLDLMPTEKRRAYLAMLRVLSAFFASGHLDPVSNRRLGVFQTYLKDLFFFPTFYTYWELGEHIQINELGRLLLRDFVREILTLDLWPERSIEDDETLEDAVQRLAPEAEAILTRALFAYLFRRQGVHYIVQEGKVNLISEYTGFLQPDRRYSDLLHLFLECKEGLRVRTRQQTIGRITIQRFMLLYRRVVGMSATAAFSQEEFKRIFGVGVVQIPAHLSLVEVLSIGVSGEPLRQEELVYVTSPEDLTRAFDEVLAAARTHTPVTVFAKAAPWIDRLERQLRQELPKVSMRRTRKPNLQRLEDLVYLTEQEKLAAAADRVAELSRRGQPILVGVPSIEIAEKFAQTLARRHPEVDFVSLDARPEHAEHEAAIVAKAGQIGRVTVATQMAGRGVDILLRPEAVECGGLFVLGIERRESPRWDEQIVGRSARQGDLGFGQFVLSLDDQLMQVFGAARIESLMHTLGMEEGEAIEHPMVTRAVQRAQSVLEGNRYRTRMLALRTDEELSFLRDELYGLRDETLAAHHSCRGKGHGPSVVHLPLTDPHWLCGACRKEQNNGQPAVLLLREGVQRLFTFGIQECLSPVCLETYLVETYTAEGEPVAGWEWEGLLGELSDALRRKVSRDEICRAPGLADRFSRVRRRRNYVPDAVYRFLESRRDPESDAYVNPRNQSYPWVEREVLRERLRVLIQRDRLEQIFQQSLKKILGLGAFDSGAIYWKLVALPFEPEPESFLGSLTEFRARVTDEKSLAAYLGERLQDLLFLDAPVGDEKLQQVAVKLSRFLRPFAVTGDEVETALATDDVEEGVRRWAMTRIRDAYAGIVQRIGKTRLYRMENQALRDAIDRHFHRFLDDYETYASPGSYRDLEDAVREKRLRIRRACSLLLSGVAQSFSTNLARHLEEPTDEDTGRDDSHQLASLLVDGWDACTCQSGAEFRRCCGASLYEIRR